jgi:hypothetical protein
MLNSRILFQKNSLFSFTTFCSQNCFQVEIFNISGINIISVGAAKVLQYVLKKWGHNKWVSHMSWFLCIPLILTSYSISLYLHIACNSQD